MARSQLFRDLHDPLVRDLVGDGPIVSEPVRVTAENVIVVGPSADITPEEEHEVDLMVDPVTTMADDHIRLAKPNRTRSHR